MTFGITKKRNNIFPDLDFFSSGMENIFDKFFNDIPARGVREYPYINLCEKGDELTLKALLPGVKTEALSIQLVNNNLIVEGEKGADYTDNNYLRKERSFGKFKKSVKLPFRVDPNKIEAELNSGVLTISLNKSEEAKPKKIEIN